MMAVHHGLQDFVQRGANGHRNHVVPGLHDLANRKFFQIDHAVDHVLEQAGKMACEATGTYDQFQFFRGVAARRAMVGVNAQRWRGR